MWMTDKTGMPFFISLVITAALLTFLLFIIQSQYSMFNSQLKFSGQTVDGCQLWTISGFSPPEFEHLRLSLISALREGEMVWASPTFVNQVVQDNKDQLEAKFEFLDLDSVDFESEKAKDYFWQRNLLISQTLPKFNSLSSLVSGITEDQLEAIRSALHVGLVESEMLSEYSPEEQAVILERINGFCAHYGIDPYDHFPLNTTQEYWKERKQLLQGILDHTTCM